MDLSLRQLQVIVAIAEERSFSGAGSRLRLSQQSVSALLRSAEDRLGARLFERTTRRVEPTPACERLLPGLSNGLGLIAEALDGVRQVGPAERPLVIAVSPAVVYGELRLLLDALERRSLPDPEIREVWADELSAGVCDGRFDAGIGVEVPENPQYSVKPWRRQRIDLLVAGNHPFAGLDEVPLARIEETVVFMPGEKTNPVLRDRLIDTFRKAGVHPRLADAPRVVGPAPVDVERGIAATVWLTGMNERYLPDGLVRIRLRDPETIVTTSLVTSRRISHSASRSLAVLRQAIDDSSGMTSLEQDH